MKQVKLRIKKIGNSFAQMTQNLNIQNEASKIKNQYRSVSPYYFIQYYFLTSIYKIFKCTSSVHKHEYTN